MNNNDDIITLHFDFDLAGLKTLIEQSGDLNDNEAVFSKLAEVQEMKDAFKTVENTFKGLESEVKQAINARAKALYGDKWQTVSGDGYKINRQRTGSVYGLMEDIKANAKFLKIVTSVDTDAVGTYVKENSKLPKGIDYNPDRGESIVIKIKKQKEE